MHYQVTDWDDAYANGIHIPGGAGYQARWERDAAAFRATARLEKLGATDLFLPEGTPKGLVVFIHGGFWLKTDPSTWSHLAAGPLARGWAVAMPGYTLAPRARIAQMAREVADGIKAAARIAGPITLTGHSAGGQLAARMICSDRLLPAGVIDRIAACVPISPLSDLRPMMRTAMNDTLHIDLAEAAAESPVLLTPLPGIPVTVWVGADERPEFVRQARLLADMWAGLGAATHCVVEPGRHHYDVIAALSKGDSDLTRAVTPA